MKIVKFGLQCGLITIVCWGRQIRLINLEQALVLTRYAK